MIWLPLHTSIPIALNITTLIPYLRASQHQPLRQLDLGRVREGVGMVWLASRWTQRLWNSKVSFNGDDLWTKVEKISVSPLQLPGLCAQLQQLWILQHPLERPRMWWYCQIHLYEEVPLKVLSINTYSIFWYPEDFFEEKKNMLICHMFQISSGTEGL